MPARPIFNALQTSLVTGHSELLQQGNVQYMSSEVIRRAEATMDLTDAKTSFKSKQMLLLSVSFYPSICRPLRLALSES